MRWVDYRNPRFISADGSAVDCDLVLPDGSTLPFTARSDDPEPLGQAVYAAILSNQVPKPITPFEVLP